MDDEVFAEVCERFREMGRNPAFVPVGEFVQMARLVERSRA